MSGLGIGAGIGVLGAFLDKMMDQVQQAIVDARNAGLVLETEAGREVALAIENAKNAYSQILDETVDKIDKAAKNTIDQLSTMVQEVQERNEVAIKTIAQKAQTLVNTLPFANLQPQVTDITPRYIVPSPKDYNARITFIGNFMFASLPDLQPKLKVNEHQFAPSANTTQELEFLIPVSVLFPTTAITNTSNYSFAAAELTIPWDRSEWFGLRKVEEISSYKVLIGALPASPGRITFAFNTQRVVTEHQHFNQGGFHLASTREAGNDDEKNHPFTVTAHTGWHVVRGSSKIESFIGQGDYTYPHYISDDGDRVTYEASTIHHGWSGSSGSMDFSIGFDEYREVTVQDPHTQVIDNLKWGDSITITHGISKITFDAFDGSHAEFAGPDLSNRYIKIETPGPDITVIKTADPQTLSFSSNSAAALMHLRTLHLSLARRAASSSS